MLRFIDSFLKNVKISDFHHPYFHSYLTMTQNKPKVLNLKQFREEKELDPGDKNYIKLRYYDKAYEDYLVGSVSYDIKNGQIGLLCVSHLYRNRSLGTELVKRACEDIQCDEVWGVCLKDEPFYKHSFKTSGLPYIKDVNGVLKWRDPIRPYLTSGGFYAKKSEILSYCHINRLELFL